MDADAIIRAYELRRELAKEAFKVYAEAVKADAPAEQRRVLFVAALDAAGFDWSRRDSK